MKSTTLLLASCSFSNVFACGFANRAREAKAAAEKSKRSMSELLLATVNSTSSNSAAADIEPGESNELLGDLLTQGPRSEVGKLIADILSGRTGDNRIAQDNGPQWMPDVRIDQTVESLCGNNRGDQCCPWRIVAEEMFLTFTTKSGRCSDYARGAIRLGFHDAGAWRKGLQHGGADGGILLTDELNRVENRGLEEIGARTREWYTKYSRYGIGMADLIQFGANVATVTCPLGPRVRTFIGRKDAPRGVQAEPNLLPDASDSADKLISLFQKKTISPKGLVALVGAHSTSQQRFFDVSRALDPQDSTPGVWDVLFYGQTTDARPKRIVKFPSDINLSRHPRTKSEWDAFAGPRGQQHWNDDYAREYVRLSLLGVNNINDLVDCTRVLPTAITGNFRAEDQYNVDQWANGGFQGYHGEIGALIGLGEIITDSSLQQNGIDPSYVSSGWGTVPRPELLGADGRPQDGFRSGIKPGNGIPRPKPESFRAPPPKLPSNGGPNGADKNRPAEFGGRPPKYPNNGDKPPNGQPKDNDKNHQKPPNNSNSGKPKDQPKPPTNPFGEKEKPGSNGGGITFSNGDGGNPFGNGGNPFGNGGNPFGNGGNPFGNGGKDGKGGKSNDHPKDKDHPPNNGGKSNDHPKEKESHPNNNGGKSNDHPKEKESHPSNNGNKNDHPKEKDSHPSNNNSKPNDHQKQGSQPPARKPPSVSENIMQGLGETRS